MDKDIQVHKIATILTDAFNEKQGKICMKELAEELYQKGCRIVPCAIGFDYIDGYKQGFKEGVIALQTQVKQKALKLTKCVNGVKIEPPVSYTLSHTDIDEIVKELVDE